MIGRKLLSLFIGSNWRTFVGDSYDTMADRTERVLSELGWPYDRHRTEPASAEQSIFGATDAVRFEIDDWGITFTSITYDPLFRTVLSIGTVESTRDKYKTSACLVDVRPVSDDNRSDIETLLQQVAAELDEDPWSINHPRFNYSPVLRYKVKVLWKYWLSSQ